MCLHPQDAMPIPENTIEVAQAAFPKGNPYMLVRDELGAIYTDEQFYKLYAVRGQPGLSPWRLAWVTVMQYAENLTDRQAADAVRARIDWKYVLGLDLKDAGFHYSVLSEFRQRLLTDEAVHQLFETMLLRLKESGMLKKHQRQRTDATHVLACVRRLNRLEIVGETLHAALNALAVAVPDWLKQQVPVEWFEIYGKHFEEYRLPHDKKDRETVAEVIGTDGMYLLHCTYDESSPSWLRDIPAVEILRQIWVQQFYQDEADNVKWRKNGQSAPSSIMIASPYDTDTRYSTKRGETWVGYKVHVTETCADDEAHFITDIQTTISTDQDVDVMRDIHSGLRRLDLVPNEHLVDTAYVAADVATESFNEYRIELLGPSRVDTSWQSLDPDAFALKDFVIDWEKQEITCPMGKVSKHWKPSTITRSKRQRKTIQVQFTRKTCADCSCREKCTRSKLTGRGITLHPTQQEHEMLQQAREYQQTDEFRERYKKRAGVEGTISLAAYTFKLRRTRYRGLDKTHLHHVCTATAINLKRAAQWMVHPVHAQTRISHFAALAA